MKLFSLNAENWKMDGGAAFGLVPKTIWSKNYPADELNYLNMKSRCLLVEDGEKLILIDTGMGRKRGEKYYSFKFIFGDDSLEKGLANHGFTTDDITDVLLTHLHDDHVGGAIKLTEDGTSTEFVFKNAMHWVSKAQWDWAMNPNKREAGTYFKDNFVPLQQFGKLTFIENEGDFTDNIKLRIFDGHTRGQVIPIIHHNGKKICYMADFIPSTAHIPIPYIAAVDIQPLIALEEKEAFLNEAVEGKYYFYFEHDFYTEVCNLKRGEKGIVLDATMDLSSIA